MNRTIVKKKMFCEVVQRCKKLTRGEAIIRRFWFARKSGRGRPAMYCSDDCAKYARSAQRAGLA